jgi:hypothetical protein
VNALSFALDNVSRIFPSYSPEKMFAAIEGDIEALESGVDLRELATSRLWQPRGVLPVRFEVPISPSGWSFWRRWYDARRNGRPTERPTISFEVDVAVAALPSDVWESGPAVVNEEIGHIVRKLREKDRDRELDDDEFPIEEDFVDPRSLGSVEGQSLVALTFRSSPDGKIDVDVEAHQDEIKTDQDATDRHTEVCDSARDIVGLFERFGLGANSVEPLVQQAERLLDALGSSPSDVRPGLLIPRGERLRQTLLAQENPDDLGSAPPLPPQFLTNLKILVSAYNVYVALDPVLERRDQARLDPDLLERLVDKRTGTKLIKSAVEAEIATPAVEDVMQEEAASFSGRPNPDRRESRRYAESVRNFARAAIDRAFAPLKALWNLRARATAS